MSARGETYHWLAQRASAAVLGVCVVVHLGTMIYAVRGGLTAAEIVGRLQGDAAWLAFYAVFVLAAAVHAPLGVRTVLKEATALPNGAVHAVTGLLFVAVLGLGLRAVIGLYGAEL